MNVIIIISGWVFQDCIKRGDSFEETIIKD